MSNVLQLPQAPGLARRLAYGEYVRQSHKRGNTNLWIRGNSLFYRALTDNYPYDYITTEPRYEELIELEDIKIGLKLSEINKNSYVYVSNIKLVLRINLCTICQEFFKPTNISYGEIIREMNCGHPYHLSCIDRWFEDHTFCPICKHDFH